MYVKLLSVAVAVELFLTNYSYRLAMKRKTRNRLPRNYRRPSDSLTAQKGTANPRHHMVVLLLPLACFLHFFYSIG